MFAYLYILGFCHFKNFNLVNYFGAKNHVRYTLADFYVCPDTCMGYI